MLDIFENTLYNHFLTCDSFDAFYKKVKEDLSTTLDELELHINNRQLAEGIHRPALMRTLLADGCIQHGKSFSAGGATYNFDSTNIYAGTNTVNSLYTLKQYYDGKLGNFPREEFLSALIDNFEGHGELFAKCKKVTKFGNYDPELNALARDLMTFTFKKVMELRCWRKNSTYEGRFMPAIILWVDWVSSGKRVGATPDGRLLGEATVDSCGPMQGTDTEGPTSVMGAALALDQGNCAGTCVLNLRLDKANFRTPEATKKVRQLLEVYFRQGGSQVQINVVDPKVLRDAYEHPEKHRDIIVRVGGFSDNFVMLDKTIQQEILKRTEHNI
jgi:formate C-acetyltransferase